MWRSGWKQLLVALLSSLSIACGDDIEDDGVRDYTTEFSILAPPSERLSRYWTFTVFFYKWPGFPDRTCIVTPYAAEVIYPSNGVASDCGHGCIHGPACSFGCTLDLQTCEVWTEGNAPRVKVFYSNVNCPEHYGLNTGFGGPTTDQSVCNPPPQAEGQDY